jgi:transcription-repair coupling factor (superfamily II helicase)
MMQSLLDSLRQIPSYQRLLAGLRTGDQLPGLALPRAARLPVLVALYTDLKQPVLLVTDRADHALQLHDELAFWLPDTSRYIFSEPNPLFYEQAAWGSTTRRERLQTLTSLAAYHLPFVAKRPSAPIIVTSARALMTRTLPRRDFLKASKQIKIGQKLSLSNLLEEWLQIGYQPADTVLEPGQFSHRGGLLDIWPQSEPSPVRLDFFGDEIDTIRRFDPGSQRTIDNLPAVLITPAREYLINGRPDTSDKSEIADQAELSDHISEFHIPLLHSFPANLLDYLPRDLW